MRRLLSSILVDCVLLGICGCSFRPIEEISGCVDVVIREHLVSGNGAAPELYRAMVYNMDGGIVVTDYLSREGGRVYAPAGKRRLLIYNFNLETINISDEGMATSIRAYTHTVGGPAADFYRAVASASGGDEALLLEDPVIFEPDNLYVYAADEDIPYLGATSRRHVITADTRNAMRKCILTVKGVTGGEWIGSVTVFLTGVAGSMNLMTGEPGSDPAIQMFAASYDGLTGCIRGNVNLFGDLPEGAGRRNLCYLCVTDTGGGRRLYVHDVTESLSRVDGLSNVMTVDLETDMVIEEPAESTPGFRPELADWNVLERPVIL